MNAIEKLKEMEAAATRRPWLQGKRSDQIYAKLPGGTVNILRTWNYGGGKGEANRALILALREIAPELLALWEEAQNLPPIPGTVKLMDALDALNAKAQEVLS